MNFLKLMFETAFQCYRQCKANFALCFRLAVNFVLRLAFPHDVAVVAMGIFSIS